MTNEERVAEVLSSLRGLRLKPSEQAACLAMRGLIAPDQPPRYTMDDQHVSRSGPGREVHVVFTITTATTPSERAAVLAALNALPEEGEKP